MSPPTTRSQAVVLAALLLGWALVTFGVASYTGRWEVWPLSVGVLLLVYAVPAAMGIARARRRETGE